MRFESKHSYFKKCARYCQNFINVCHTFAERHQLLQAFYSSGSLFETAVFLQDSIPLTLELYNDDIQKAYNDHHVSVALTNVMTSCSGVIQGSKYNRNDYVAVEFTEAGILFGKIVMLFQHAQTSQVCFLVRKVESEYNPDMGIYELSKVGHQAYKCVAHSDLKSYSPLQSYNKDNNMEVIVLKHALLSTQYIFQ